MCCLIRSHQKKSIAVLFLIAVVLAFACIVLVNMLHEAKSKNQKLIVHHTINPNLKYEQTRCMSENIELFISPKDRVGNLDTLTQTLKFMLQNVEEDNPEFINFVRSLIKFPAGLPINLNDKHREDFSQVGQSSVVDNVLKHKKNGFFIEAGGLNGEDFSNTLFFEMKRNWTGLLIEPITTLYDDLVRKNRNIYSINACIAGKKPFIAKLRIAGALSGRQAVMSDKHKKRVNYEHADESYLFIPCLPLYTILKAINVNNVDYFSLDIEGGEWDVVKSLPFDKISFNVFTIEYPANPENTELIKTRLHEKNYDLFKVDGSDLYFSKKTD